MQDKPTYEAAWKVLQTLNQLLLLIVASNLAVILVFATISLGLEPQLPNFLLYAVVALCLVVILAFGTLRSTFHCPRCGEFFFLKGRSSNLLSGQCVHCGLRRGAASPVSAR
jgi:predicted RNA-binding Zn-ribbon protein involved in translation (DUF1610 family)